MDDKPMADPWRDQALDPWRLPLFLWSGWLTQWLCLVAPDCPICAPPPDHDEHDQLEVPEPIEAEGEHALFA